MTKTFSLPLETAAYLAAVRTELADLSPDERDDLLADVEVSLREASEEGDPLVAVRLGPPAAFAAELRTAAGVETATGVGTGGAPARVRGAHAARLRAQVRHLRGHPRSRTAARALLELAPLWWVARAFVATAALALALGGGWSLAHPALPRVGGAALSALVLAALTVISVAFGLTRGARVRSWPPRRVGAALNAGLALGSLLVAAHVVGAQPPERLLLVNTGPELLPGLSRNGSPVRNIYPYSREGRPLYDVLLYDDRGKPLDLGGATSPDPRRRVLVSATGAQLFNSFPVRYYERHTRRVTHPRAGPRVRAPQVVTPPLAARR